MTLHAKPPAATHWSVRWMAKASGVSPSAAPRIRKAHGLRPHMTRSFKLSGDPNFNAKVADIVGLCLDPPEKASPSTRKARSSRSIGPGPACR